MAPVKSALKSCVIVVVLGSTGWAQVTQLVSFGPDGAQWPSRGHPSISADGRYVAIDSDFSDVILIRDRRNGTTEAWSVGSAPSISADGRCVAFLSDLPNLVPGDTNGADDVFVRDRSLGTIELVSVDSAGVQGNSDCYGVSISADGRFVAFGSGASNLVPGDSNGFFDIFVHDRLSGTTEQVSVTSSGGLGNRGSYDPSISADGRYVAYASEATNLVPGDTNHVSDVFVRDRQSGTTEWVSAGLPLFGVVDNVFLLPSISADGRYVAFSWTICDACNWYIFVRDRQSGTTELASVDSSGVRANSYSLNPSISGDGRFVAFASLATNLVPGDTNLAGDVFVRDRSAGTTERVSVDSGGVQGNGDSGGVFNNGTSISAKGRYVAFSSFADNLVPGDGNGQPDAFVHDRAHGGHATLCEPGLSGVIGCPCSNPPSGPGRGCDNSSATGGASLSVSGGEYLSSDSLFVTTSDENATALSIVLQGTISSSPGTIYGQGVRCVEGSLKRLYTKTASAGSITAPDFAAGDPTVHARSAAVGDAIPAGSTRWYMVLYRDSTVAGGCPGSSTINTTQARQVTWLP